MSESNPTGPGTPFAPQAATPESEAPRMSPLARLLNVFFSPGAVFEDVKRSCRGWWVPIVVGAIITAVFGSLYVAKYDMALVVGEQMKNSSGMKLMSNLMGPENRDKIVAAAVKQIEVTPAWQMQVSQWVQSLVGWGVVIWFFTFLYALMALAMGWLGETRGSKLFISLGLIAACAVLYIAITGAIQIANAVSHRPVGGGQAAGGVKVDVPITPQPVWVVIASVVLGLLAAAAIFWILARLAREPLYGRMISVVALSAAPGILAVIVGIIIVLIRTPDATPQDELVPASLAGLLNLKGEGPLVSLASSLNLFTIWAIVLTSLGLAKVLGKRVGQAAMLVLIPWGLWVLAKTALAAMF